MKKRLLLFVMLLLVLTTQHNTTQVTAQGRSLEWLRWDVAIDQVDTRANAFRVTETYQIAFSGQFTFGTAAIPMGRLEGIDGVAVTDNGRPLAASCSGNPGTFCARRRGTDFEITYYFIRPVVNETVTIVLSYRVLGALRSYTGGDQLWWDAIPEEHFGYPIRQAVVTVEMPNGFAPREGIDPVVTYGAPSEVSVSGTRIRAAATRALGGSEGLSIRIQYPHDPNGRPPAWQAAFDEQREFEETVLPLVTIGGLLVAVVVALGGTLGIIALYNARGRDPKIGIVPEYLSEPPSGLRPALVGALIDERADPRDVIATFIDMAHRGYLVIEQDRKEGLFGIGQNSFTFKRTDKPLNDLQPYERALMSAMFSGGRMERDLASMRERFYKDIAHAQNALYSLLVSEGFFRENPETTRTMYAVFGGVLFVLALVGISLLGAFVEQVGLIALIVPGSLIVPAVGLILVAPAMPAKTRKGAEEAAKWKAFYRYLSNLEKYTSVEQARGRFEAYLPYAVAFGLDKQWVRAFARLDDMPIPSWYYPVYRGSGWGRGIYTPGTPLPSGDMAGAFPGDVARAGGGGMLNDLSGGLSGGLDAISSGLTELLDSASQVMTSRPQQASSGSSGSWRGGGSSWSGGGFSGGGGSGGGSRGFG
jgi:uncharacterized membrane protein YgcG